jgi:hypothetical protein
LSGAVGDYSPVRFSVKKPITEFVRLNSYVLGDSEAITFVAKTWPNV